MTVLLPTRYPDVVLLKYPPVITPVEVNAPKAMLEALILLRVFPLTCVNPVIFEALILLRVFPPPII